MIRNTYLAYILAFAFMGSAFGPIVVALADHKWRLPVEQFLPGGSALFFPPVVLVIFSFVSLTFRYRNLVGLGVKAIALGLSLLGAIAGLIASIPVVCAIAGQCV